MSKKLTPELKAKWVEALQSGRYQQGRDRLRSSDDTYCCLGVLCDVIDPTGWTARETEDYRTGYVYGKRLVRFGRTAHSTNASYVPPGVVSIDFDIQQRLAWANDEGKTFTEIAQMIKENL